MGAGLGGAATFLYLRREQQQRALVPAGGGAGGGGFSAATGHPALKHGMPVGDRLRLFSDFVASFDTRLRNPRWVLEHVSAPKLAQRDGSRQNSTFVEDAGAARGGSVGQCGAACGVWSRAAEDSRLAGCRVQGTPAAGAALTAARQAACCHPPPAGIERRFRSKLEDYRGSGFDRGHMAPAANHKRSQAAMDDTFTLTNMSPQARPLPAARRLLRPPTRPPAACCAAHSEHL